MLTRQQIQRLAQRHAIGLHAQERDYLQHLILSLLYSRPQNLVFKGGTALRLAYRGNRYSEDLDFNAPEMNATGVETEWQAVVTDLAAYGIEAELRNPWRADVGYSVDLSYRGPLFDGRDRTKGKVRLDANLRPEVVDVQSVLVTSEYDDIRPFVISVISREHLLAEKVRALLVRGKARDLYDLWLLVNQGVNAPEALIQTKLNLYDLAWSKKAWIAGVARVETEWERDLRPLIPQFIDFANAKGQVEAALSFPPE
jgi:predicted nucleotidyltransferase component of viral defense system